VYTFQCTLPDETVMDIFARSALPAMPQNDIRARTSTSWQHWCEHKTGLRTHQGLAAAALAENDLIGWPALFCGEEQQLTMLIALQSQQQRC